MKAHALLSVFVCPRCGAVRSLVCGVTQDDAIAPPRCDKAKHPGYLAPEMVFRVCHVYEYSL